MRLLLIIAFGYVCGAEHPTVADESESIMTEPFGLLLRWIYSKRQGKRNFTLTLRYSRIEKLAQPVLTLETVRHRDLTCRRNGFDAGPMASVVTPRIPNTRLIMSLDCNLRRWACYWTTNASHWASLRCRELEIGQPKAMHESKLFFSAVAFPLAMRLRGLIFSFLLATTCADFTRRDRVRLLGYDIPPAGGLVARDYATCCSACAAATNCTAFTLDTTKQRCYLKSSIGTGAVNSTTGIVGYKR